MRLHRLGASCAWRSSAGPTWSTSTSSPTPATRPTWPRSPTTRATASCTATSPTRRPWPRRWTGCEVVVNLAAESHVDRSILGPEDFIRTDVVGTATLLGPSARGGRAPLRAGLHRRGLRLDRRGRVPRGRPAAPVEPLLGEQGRRRPAGAGLAPHVRRRRDHHPRLQHLRPAPVPREADPAVRHQRAGRRAPAGLRRRPAGARLDPRRRPLRGHLDRPGAGRRGRGLQRRRRQRGAQPRDHPAHPGAHRPRRGAGPPRHGPPRPRPPLRARHGQAPRPGVGAAAGVRGRPGRHRALVRRPARTGGSRSSRASTGPTTRPCTAVARRAGPRRGDRAWPAPRPTARPCAGAPPRG